MPSKVKKKEIKRGGAISGAAAGILSTLVLLAAYAILIDKNAELSEYADAAVIAVNILGAVICGSVATIGREQNKIPAAVISGLIYSLIIILAALTISADNIRALVICQILLISLVGSAVGSAIHLCKRNKKLRFKGNRR